MADLSPLNSVKRVVTGKTNPSAAATLGRFELRRVLGKGAQSTVWLAFDPRLEREVALKLMLTEENADASAIAQWLQEARNVSRLTHPNIVPVFEADAQGQQPYLVFEYVPGKTLSDMLRQRGALPPAEAVALTIDILDALVAAHTAGVVHRDLKPSNVLVDESGKARVMDFGISARMQDAHEANASVLSGGTPGYISPEAASGAVPAPSMDIFSAGIVLAELLAGKPLIAERDPYRAIHRVVHEQLMLPAELSTDVNDPLRAIVMRALARDPAQRYASAQLFRDELKKWATPDVLVPEGQGDASNGPGSSGTLQFLLRRMRHKSDFPALSDSVVRIQGMANSDRESVGTLTNEILKDVALTNKLLRLVNSVNYAQCGKISTVSRAVSLVGFNGIRNMALSLVLLEHMQDKSHANLLKEEFLRSLMAGSIAAELCTLPKESEEAFIGSMFQNLGRLLTEFYFPEEARQVRNLTAAKRNPVSETAASATVLGLNFEALGVGVAKAWGLPEGMQRCMRKPVGDPPGATPDDVTERLRWIAVAANDISDALLRSPADELAGKLVQLAHRYARSLGMTSSDIQKATNTAREKLVELARAMELKVMPGSAAAKLLMSPPSESETSKKTATDKDDTLTSHELHATRPTEPETVVTRDARHVNDVLSAGIQDITNAMVEDFRLTDVLRMILETMFRAMDFQRIVFCMRDPKTNTLTGRFGLGADIDKVVPSFKVSLKAGAGQDLFTAVCTKGADTMISDATEPRLAQRLPVWYRETINAPTFLLLPLQIKAAPFGLIYADKAKPGGLALDEKELAMLRTLRNQAVMAFRQSS
jgi:serine/threonine protein kinase